MGSFMALHGSSFHPFFCLSLPLTHFRLSIRVAEPKTPQEFGMLVRTQRIPVRDIDRVAHVFRSDPPTLPRVHEGRLVVGYEEAWGSLHLC